MEYSLDGRSSSQDPHINKQEPINPDALAAGERPHVEKHLIRSVAKTNSEGVFQAGISDRACVGCHRGSGRTVLQYWGVRLDQNQDLANGTQFPANPETFTTAADDKRFFDTTVNNQTFTGANANQLIVFEDYDGDGRDDTPADVHYEAGMGCIDCHSSRDMHGGVTGDKTSGRIVSRMEQNVFTTCISCHGGTQNVADTVDCTTYTGEKTQCVVDSNGNPLRHVTKNSKGEFWLVSRVNNKRMYVKQTYESIVNDPTKIHPLTGDKIYNPLASYAMGRADGNSATGIGPLQQDTNKYTSGFSHNDNLSCTSCHAAWTNSCNGCHVTSKYNADPANYTFDKIKGARSVMDDPDTNFGYQSGISFILGVDTKDKITATMPMSKMFYKYIDKNGVESAVLTANDRNGNGNNPGNNGRGNFPALGHQKFAAHSIRGAVTPKNEGAMQCVACHMTQAGINNFGADYNTFRQNMNANTVDGFKNLDFNFLKQHFGQNPGNQLNSPFFTFGTAGLGSGLLLYDQTGCPLNPLDNNANRQGCNNGAPATNFENGAALNNTKYNIDRIVEPNGVANGSNIHPLQTGQASNLRDGALDPAMSGPLGRSLIQMMTDPANGLILDSWINADGAPEGQAGNLINK